jgi:hypothetical protein
MHLLICNINLYLRIHIFELLILIEDNNYEESLADFSKRKMKDSKQTHANWIYRTRPFSNVL